MSRRAPNSLYQATFSQRSSSTPVSPVTNNGCCGPKDDIHEPNIVELAATLNKREFEIRTLIQKNMALNKILQNQGPPRISTSTYGIVPPHSVDMRDDVYQHYMREEEYRIQSNGAGVLHSKKDNMIELLKQEKAKLKDKTKSLEKTVKTLNDEIAMYKKQLHASKALAEEQSQIHRENEHIVNDLKEKNADLWKKWKKEIYTVKGKDALLDVQRQRMEEQENLIQNYEKKFPSGVVDIPKLLARVDEGERVWAKIDMRELRLKERKIIIRTQRDEIASLKLDKKELKNEVDLLKKCYAALHLELSETGDRIDMSWLLSQLRNNATLKEKNAELEEMLVGKGYTVKAAEAENDLRKKELELTTEIEEIKAIKEVMESLRDNANDGDGIEISELLNKLEVAILMLGSEGVPNERVGAIVHNNAILKDRVSELEEIIRGQGYTVKAAAAERDLRTKEVNLAEKVQTITEVLETLNDVIDGVDNTEAAVLLRRLEEVLLSFSYEREPSMEILTQHSIISEVGWNLGCVTYEPNDYAALAIGQSDSTVTTIRTPSSARSDGVWTQLHQSEAVTKD